MRRPFLSLAYLLIFFSPEIYASEIMQGKDFKYEHSFFSPTKIVTFYSVQLPNASNEERYNAFSIATCEPIHNLTLEQKDVNSYYYTYPPQFPLNHFSSLEDDLQTLNNPSRQHLYKDFSSLVLSPESSIIELVKAIKDCGILNISFGAGISQGFIPTLEESCEQLDLIKIKGSDNVTNISMSSFIKNLVSSPENTLKRIKDIWCNVTKCILEETPAHKALKNLIDSVKKENKKIFVYTDNIDGIHKKCGIELSRTESKFIDSTTSTSQVIYPTVEDIKNQKVVSLIIGQSFDFDGVHSTIYTVTTPHAQENKSYIINVKQEPIKIWKDLDVNVIREKQDFDISLFEAIVLPTQAILGNVQTILPEIYKRYSQL